MKWFVVLHNTANQMQWIVPAVWLQTNTINVHKTRLHNNAPSTTV